jgi:hypothetical protein
MCLVRAAAVSQAPGKRQWHTSVLLWLPVAAWAGYRCVYQQYSLRLLLLLQNEPMIFSPAPNCTPDHMSVLHSLSSTKIALLVELPAHDLVLCPEAALTGGAAVIIGVLRARQGLPAASTAAAAAEVVRHAETSPAAAAAGGGGRNTQATETEVEKQQQVDATVQPAAAVSSSAVGAAVVDAPETPAAAAAAHASASAAAAEGTAAAAASGTAGPQAQDAR